MRWSLSIAAALGCLVGSVPATAQTIRVIDGDTIAYQEADKRGFLGFGSIPGTLVICRLIGFDTPELQGAQCDAEKVLATKAKARVADLVRDYRWRVSYGVGRDRYGRRLCRLYIRGEDIGGILIAEKLARPYDGRRPRGTWCGEKR